MKKITSKERSVKHEKLIEVVYGGVRSKSSGASLSDPGDVRTDREIFECKTTGDPDSYRRSITLKLDDFEKVADEAWSEGRHPAMAMQIHNPASVLADASGNVNFIVRLLDDDIQRKWK